MWDLNGWSVVRSLGSEVRGSTWVMSDFVGHVRSFHCILMIIKIIKSWGDHKVRSGYCEWVLAVRCPCGVYDIGAQGKVRTRGRVIVSVWKQVVIQVLCVDSLVGREYGQKEGQEPKTRALRDRLRIFHSKLGVDRGHRKAGNRWCPGSLWKRPSQKLKRSNWLARDARRAQNMKIPLSLHLRPSTSNVSSTEEALKVHERREWMFSY